MNIEYVWLALIVGWVLHQVGDLAELSMKAGKPAELLPYVKKHPWRLALSIVGVFAGMIVFYPSLQNQVAAGLDQEALTLAMGIGYAGDSYYGSRFGSISSVLSASDLVEGDSYELRLYIGKSGTGTFTPTAMTISGMNTAV